MHVSLQGNPFLEEMKETAKYISKRGKGILARYRGLATDHVVSTQQCSCS